MRLATLGLAALLVASCAGMSGGNSSGRSSPVESRLLAESALERGEYRVAVQQYLNVARQSRDPEFARTATELAWEYGYDAYALAAAERWLALAPDDAEAQGYLGRLYARRNDLEQAWTMLEESLGDPAERTDQDYALLAGDLSGPWARRGLKLFERFASTYPQQPGVNRALAELAAQSGDVKRAIAAARDTLSVRPDWYTTRVWLARLLLLDGKQSSAFEQISFALEMNPGIELEIEFVQLLSMAGETDTALARLERLGERHEGMLAIDLVRASVLLADGQVDAARENYRELLRAGSCLNECLWQLGSIAYAEGDFPTAMQLFNGIRSGDRLRQARLAVSQCQLELGDPAAALQVLEEFAEALPQTAIELFQPRASIYASQGQWDEAVAMIDQALDYSPWNEALWLYRGSLLEQSGDPERALDAFRTAQELVPDDPTVLNALGYTLTIHTRQYREAYDYIRQALDGDPDNPAIMDSMGWVLFKLGRNDEALEWLRRAYEQMPDPEIAAHLGEVLWLMGERAEARQIWEAALNDYADSVTLRETVQRLQR